MTYYEKVTCDSRILKGVRITKPIKLKKTKLKRLKFLDLIRD
ncbi:hypothetical protein BH23THE1_BH23THE1_20860 [soil metagenome]